jgi:Nucleoplasmin-like domain
MFWGHTLQQGSTLNLSSLRKKGDILHLSHINLHPGSSEGKTTVFIMHEGKKYPLAYLSPQSSYVDFDLYLTTQDGPVFSVQGNGQVSLLGYFPPKMKS